MKNLVSIALICLLLISCKGKSIQNIPNILNENKYTNSEIEFLIEKLEISNTLNGISTLKKDIDVSKKKYHIEFILETYENDSLIEEKTIFSGRSFHNLDSVRTKYMDKLILAIKRRDSETNYFTFIYGNNINKITQKITIKPAYLRPFGLMPFEKQENIEIDKSIPFAIYGAFWEDDFNGTKIMRFCGGNLESRTDDQFYGKSPYYYIFTYKFTK